MGLMLDSRAYKALMNLPGKNLFPAKQGDPFNHLKLVCA